MVTSAIAHPSKSENLVYAVLPVTFAVWIVGWVPWFAGQQGFPERKELHATLDQQIAKEKSAQQQC